MVNNKKKILFSIWTIHFVLWSHVRSKAALISNIDAMRYKFLDNLSFSRNKDGLRPGAGGKRLDKIERLDKNKKIDTAGQTT